MRGRDIVASAVLAAYHLGRALDANYRSRERGTGAIIIGTAVDLK